MKEKYNCKIEISSLMIAECLGGNLLDSNNIAWKKVNGEWIGKRSVWTKDWRMRWLEETTKDNVETWWCGEDADYTEIFRE